MSDEAAMINALREQPLNDMLRLVYADWLDEHGRSGRASLIRLQVEYAKHPPTSDIAQGYENEIVELLKSDTQLFDELRKEYRNIFHPSYTGKELHKIADAHDYWNQKQPVSPDKLMRAVNQAMERGFFGTAKVTCPEMTQVGRGPGYVEGSQTGPIVHEELSAVNASPYPYNTLEINDNEGTLRNQLQNLDTKRHPIEHLRFMYDVNWDTILGNADGPAGEQSATARNLAPTLREITSYSGDNLTVESMGGNFMHKPQLDRLQRINLRIYAVDDAGLQLLIDSPNFERVVFELSPFHANNHAMLLRNVSDAMLTRLDEHNHKAASSWKAENRLRKDYEMPEWMVSAINERRQVAQPMAVPYTPLPRVERDYSFMPDTAPDAGVSVSGIDKLASQARVD